MHIPPLWSANCARGAIRSTETNPHRGESCTPVPSHARYRRGSLDTTGVLPSRDGRQALSRRYRGAEARCHRTSCGSMNRLGICSRFLSFSRIGSGSSFSSFSWSVRRHHQMKIRKGPKLWWLARTSVHLLILRAGSSSIVSSSTTCGVVSPQAQWSLRPPQLRFQLRLRALTRVESWNSVRCPARSPSSCLAERKRWCLHLPSASGT